MNFKIMALLAAGCVGSLFGGVVYSTIPAVLPPDVPSWGYEAVSAAEIGNAISLEPGADRYLTNISVVMSNWAFESIYQPIGTSAGFYHPLTMNLYETTNGTAVGSLFASKTVNALIAWRPEPNAGCTNDEYLAEDTCYGGASSLVTFDFSGDSILLPNSLIYGLAFNTQSSGANPIGTPGPYNSLNFGVGETNPSPLAGSNIYADSAYINTKWADFYTDLGAGGTGTFRLDSGGWGAYQPNIQIEATATPEPGTLLLFGGAIVLLAATRRRAVRARE